MSMTCVVLSVIILPLRTALTSVLWSIIFRKIMFLSLEGGVSEAVMLGQQLNFVNKLFCVKLFLHIKSKHFVAMP